MTTYEEVLNQIGKIKNIWSGFREVNLTEKF